ncbi:MAG: SPFH domain-containing protein [Eubacteriales bacterium]
MGLIKSTFTAATSAVSSTLADQWKEYFAINSMPKEVLVCAGQKIVNGKSANSSSNNVISDGSGISIADGQCAIIVEQGKIVEFCAEPGVFTYSNKTAPSVFTGNLGESIANSFKTIGARFAMGGGSTGSDQRVYYFNLKEIMENRYGTSTPIPFRVVGRNNSFDLDTSVKCNGQYSYRIVDPILFYTNVCGNVSSQYQRSEIDSTLKSELLTALQPALGKLSALGIRHSDIPAHTMEITNSLNEILSKTWTETRGIKVVSFGMNSVSIPEEDAAQIRQLQLNENPNLAAANLAAAQAEAMKTAAGNSAGSLHGFMGMNMAGGMGGMNAASLFQQGQQQQPMYGQQMPPNQGQMPPQVAPSPDAWQCTCGTSNTGKFCSSCGTGKPAPAGTWQCSCSTVNSSKFCSNCGKPQPMEQGWTCSCGATNPGKFCQDCGKAKPSGAPLYRCDKCGFNPPDPKNPPKFCPECGDTFDDQDVVS